jgi:hypothetical protein
MVDWIGLAISDAKGKITYDGAFLTSLRLTRENVVEIAACVRARWKIENESFNVLKNNGYHLEHNFGHGKENLAMMFVAMNLLAFAFHTVCDCMDQGARGKTRPPALVRVQVQSPRRLSAAVEKIDSGLPPGATTVAEIVADGEQQHPSP